jgi:tetratricopeptide (TPR) repeat protein
MGKFLSEIYDKIASSLFKGVVFKEFRELNRKGAYEEAYRVYRDIYKKHPKWLKKGDPYVTCAKLEFLANQDNDGAMKLLEKAKELGCSDKPYYFLVLGQVFWRKIDIDNAIKNLQKCVELEPAIPNLKAFGEMLSCEKDKRAVEIWEKILKKDSKNAVALAYLGMEARRAGNHEQSHILSEKADKLAKYKEDFFEIGRMYFRERQLEKAIQYYVKCDELDYKTHGMLYHEISLCYYQLKNYQSATLYAGKALNVHFDNEYAKSTLLHCTEQQFNGPLLHDIINQHPDTCLAYLLLAHEARHDNDFLRADELLSKAIEMEPSLTEMCHIARLFHYANMYDKAITTYLKCEEFGYEYPGFIYTKVAICYFALDDYESAIKYSIKALELDFTNDEIKDTLLYNMIYNEVKVNYEQLLMINQHTSFTSILCAHEALKQLNVSEARELAEKAQHLNPSIIEKFYIAWLYSDLEDFQKALEIFQECEKSGFENKFRLYQSFACCYYELEEYAKAIDYAEKVLSIEPDNEDAKEIIYDSKEAAGEFGDSY